MTSLRYGGPIGRRAFRFFLDEGALHLWLNPRGGGWWLGDPEPVLPLLQTQLPAGLQSEEDIEGFGQGTYRDNPVLYWREKGGCRVMALLGSFPNLLRWDGEGRLKGIWRGTSKKAEHPFEPLWDWLQDQPAEDPLPQPMGEGPAGFREQRLEDLRRHFQKKAQGEEKKARKRLNRLQQEKGQAEKDQEGRAWADWLLAAGGASLAQRGFASADEFEELPGLPRPGADPPALDATLTLQENTAKLYHRAQRARLRVTQAEEKMANARQQEEEYQARAEALGAMEEKELLDLAREVSKQQRKAKNKAKHRPEPGAGLAGVRRVELDERWTALVGRSAKANDLVTRKAKPQDFWFHAADYPGSHVVLPNPGKVPMDKVPGHILEAAARLAAENSQARGRQVGVNWTQKKFLKRPRGAKPGQVLLERFKTLLVRLTR